MKGIIRKEMMQLRRMQPGMITIDLMTHIEGHFMTLQRIIVWSTNGGVGRNDERINTTIRKGAVNVIGGYL
jgi:hypothetical protein